MIRSHVLICGGTGCTSSGSKVLMSTFEEELKKFHPSLEIEEAEDAIYNQDLTDMADLLVSLVKEDKEESNGSSRRKQ